MSDAPTSSAPTVTFVPDLLQTGQDLFDRDASGVQSTVIHSTANSQTQLFAFDAGDAFPEHAVDRHAVLHFLQGDATVTLRSNARDVHAGSWIYVPPNLPHSVSAHSPTLLLLQVLPLASS